MNIYAPCFSHLRSTSAGPASLETEAWVLHVMTHLACKSLSTAHRRHLMSTNPTPWARWQLLEEPASSSDSSGQTCLCLSNHTRRYRQSVHCVLLLSVHHSVMKTSSQGWVETSREWVLTHFIWVAQISIFHVHLSVPVYVAAAGHLKNKQPNLPAHRSGGAVSGQELPPLGLNVLSWPSNVQAFLTSLDF